MKYTRYNPWNEPEEIEQQQQPSLGFWYYVVLFLTTWLDLWSRRPNEQPERNNEKEKSIGH